MVVQHNLAAMNSNRMLGITTGKQAKVSEKLSSGYRINRAADDAAGLSISEKMRKQINGLSRASTNAQDGVSSVQTAEGALSEVHSMLQRMNELSVQAANGTNSVDDRNAIQSEISQLTTEINRVAETTKFNETYLLKGNGKPGRHYPKGHDAGLKGQLIDSTTTAEFQIPELVAGSTMNIAGTEYTIGAGKENAKDLIETAALDANMVAALALNAGQRRAGYETQIANLNTQAADYAQRYAELARLRDDARAEETRYAAQVNQKVFVNDTTYTAFYQYPAGAVWNESPVNINHNDLPTAALPVPSGSTVRYNNTTLNIMIDEDNGGNGDGIDDYDNTIVTDTIAYDYIQKELTAANNIGTTAQKAEVTFTVANGMASFHITKGFANITEALSFALHVGSDADLTNKISVNIQTMSAANLGIDGMNISDDSGLAATYAIDAITDALAIVSEQRSELGAIQNRLEHTILNLDNVVENTTESESRIRDTDMAEAMVEYSKNNILAQAGQAMLAQANSSTEGVLSLLQ